MGSLSLACPMCCGETFASNESLKYHLLSMMDNLYCPGCSLRTYSIAALIQHLDRCGKDEPEPDEAISKGNALENGDIDREERDILMVSWWCERKI